MKHPHRTPVVTHPSASAPFLMLLLARVERVHSGGVQAESAAAQSLVVVLRQGDQALQIVSRRHGVLQGAQQCCQRSLHLSLARLLHGQQASFSTSSGILRQFVDKSRAARAAGERLLMRNQAARPRSLGTEYSQSRTLVRQPGHSCSAASVHRHCPVHSATTRHAKK